MTADMNFENRTIFHADNLPVLRGMNSATIDLIATDPPFNKGRDFRAAPESLATGARFQDRWTWNDDVEGAWVDQIKDETPAVWSVIEFARHSYGDDMGAFLAFMGVRLMEMHRVLKPTGSIYLHCDPTASHYLKALMDAIFGKRNFRNELIWWYKNASRGKKRFANSHDVIFWFSRSRANYRFNRDDVLIPFESKMTEWRYSKGGQAGREMPKGKTPDDVILMPSLNTMDKERVGYPTQKPLALYELIVKASSKPGDIVLDPFAGCATTPIAAERLGRRWVGIDIWEKAHETVMYRLRQENLATPEGVYFDEENRQLLTLGDVHYTTRLPERTDGGDAATPNLPAKYRRLMPKAKWQRKSREEMVEILAEAQGLGTDGLVACAGCGRALESEFFHLDHRMPRADGGEHWITNRVLLCAPCNGRKGDKFTLRGLWRENKRNGWMKNEQAAKDANDRALLVASKIRDEGEAEERERLLASPRPPAF